MSGDTMADPVVIDVNEDTFEREVLQRSDEVPVVIDFWAAWCGPCRQLSPVLERLAHEANGGWVLAKIDVDRNPMLAGAFGVQGIPAVKAIHKQRVVNEFVGAMPEQAVRAWLQSLGPTAADLAADEGRQAEARGDLAAAADAYRRALAEAPAFAEAKAGLARVELAMRTASADEGTLRRRAEADPADVDAVTALADLEFAAGRVEDAAGRLVETVSATSGNERDRARRHLLDLLDTLPPEDPRGLAARRALAAVLY